MKKVSIVAIALLLVATSAMAMPDRHPMVNHERIVDHTGPVPADVPRVTFGFNELDEVTGDTIVVGYTYWDAQHNGTVGRMNGYSADSSRAYVVWTKLFSDNQADSRHVMYNEVWEEDGSLTLRNDGTAQVDLSARAGYTTLGYRPDTAEGFPSFHATPSAGGDYSSTIASESPWVPDFFEVTYFPAVTGEEVLWPKSVWGSTNHMHTISTANRADNAAPQSIYYMQYHRDPANPSAGWVASTTSGEQVLITDLAMNIASDIAVSSDGSKVAIGQTMGRENTINEIYTDGGTQHNNDLWIWESTDGGTTWPAEHTYNPTDWIGPDESLLPDTVKAQRDTMRAYTDNSLIYDGDDNLHAAFSAQNMFILEGLISYGSRIYHWDQVNGVNTMIHNGHEGFIGGTEAWGRTADRPSLYFDDATGILWCVFQRASNSESNPDTTDYIYRDPYFFVARDIHVAASPPGPFNGLLWTESVNITRTIYTGEEEGSPGDYMSEQDPSIALDSDGDYLHISYLLDGMPGIAIGQEPDSEMSENPFIYHRVAKQALIDSFEARGEWVVNYPMHVSELDENGEETGVHMDHWEDPGEYMWEEFGGFFTTDVRDPASVEDGALTPSDFELEQNYPNPFNPSTSIRFNLAARGAVRLAVYDVMGREVATLVDRQMDAGRHSVTFLADELPSGVYFYRLTSGDATQVRKMVLMK